MTLLDVDLQDLPDGPLSMSVLLSLRSEPLRRLLKGGLKRGLAPTALADLMAEQWSCSVDSAEAQQLLLLLDQKGWFSFREAQQVWKTHLGQRAAF